MANSWKQVDEIAAEALMQMQDRLVITNLASRDKTSDFNKTPDGYSKGDTVRIKTRPDYEAQEFAGSIIKQEIRESTRSMTIEKHFDISVALTAKEKALDLESFVEQVVTPAAYRLAEKADSYVGSKITKAAGLYVSNALFTDAADMALARKAANLQQLNPTGRFCIVDDTLESTLLGKDYFNKYNNRGDSGVVTFQEAILGRAMGMQFYTAPNTFPSWTLAAAGAGSATTNNGTASGGVYPNNKIGDSVLVVDSVDASSNTFPAGTRIQVAGMRRPLIVKTLANSATLTQIELVDPITEIVPDGAAVTIIGSGQSNLVARGIILDSQAIAVAMPLLDMPSDKLAYSISNNGVSIRVVTGYDMDSKTDTMSLDLLIGAEAYDPRRMTLLAEY